MAGVVEVYDVYLCPSPHGRVCVALTCGVPPDKGARTIGGLAEGMDEVRLYHLSATARWLGVRWDEGRGDGRKQRRWRE